MAPQQRRQPSRAGRSLPKAAADPRQTKLTFEVVLPHKRPSGEFLRLSPTPADEPQPEQPPSSDDEVAAQQSSGSDYEAEPQESSGSDYEEDAEQSSDADDTADLQQSSASEPEEVEESPVPVNRRKVPRRRRLVESSDEEDGDKQSSEGERSPPPKRRRQSKAAVKNSKASRTRQLAESSDATSDPEPTSQDEDKQLKSEDKHSLRQSLLPWASTTPKTTRATKTAKTTKPTKRTRRPAARSSDDTADLEQTSQGALRLDLPPIANVHHAFQDMLSKRRSDIVDIANDGGLQLRVGTICSGTEAPVFALDMIKVLAENFTGGQKFIQFEHVFSVENEPFKQAYISRNAPNSIVFRDVVDFADIDATAAPTILGDHREIPRDIDLLVAGTSCVDFSTLNNGKRDCINIRKNGAKLAEEWKKSEGSLRKDFFDDVHEWLTAITPAEIQTAGKSIGESSLTFLSTICYMDKHRPKMAIFENVNGAPWSSICGFFLRAIDYEATHCPVDTKDYYIPQTRQRGYAVAVDRKVFGSASKKIVEEWKAQLASLKRGASSPVHDWLLPSNDPLTMKARQDESEKAIASGLNPGKDSQWERSKLRHNRVRRQFKLGQDRPLTGWGLSGIQRPYDRIDRLVLKGQNDRALDCVEIYYLRCLQAGADSLGKNMPAGPAQYDIKFKSQIFDLSQNIDRSQLNRNFGITGCLTPRGLNLITNEGRLVSGFEALNLQGLPLRDLDLTRESQEELRDLAGNAMTTTVVGASLFSLLISVKLHSKKISPSPLGAITNPIQTVVLNQPLYRTAFPKSTAKANSGPDSGIMAAVDVARRSRRYCYCNGGAKYSTAELLECQTCGIIRCTSCAGNPTHQFGSPQHLENPIMNDTVPEEIMKHFPTALTDVVGTAIDRIPFHPSFEDDELQKLLLDSLRSSTFYYTNVLISEAITICYTAKETNCCFHLKAIVTENSVTWYLFLDPWSVGGKKLCEKLGVPPARMLRPFGRVRIHKQKGATVIPKQDAWEFWVFSPVSFTVDVTKIEDPTTTSLEVEVVSLEDVPPAIHNDVRSISGTYEYHPECDAAEDSLHVRMEPSKLFLFKDPTKIGMTQDDCYVISDECRYLESYEFRDLAVKFPPSWKHETSSGKTKVTIAGYWEKPALASVSDRLVRSAGEAGFVSIPPASLLHPDGQAHNIRTLASVCMSSNILDDTFMTLSKYGRVGSDKWAIVSRSDYSALFDLLAPVNVRLGDIESTIRSAQTGICQTCCPNLPDVYWMEKESTDDAKKSVRIREPYRLSSDMRSYEEKLRLCGEPFQVIVNITPSKKGDGWKDITANYEANYDLLVHRAVNHLPRLADESEDFGKMSTFVSVERGSLNIPNLKFESFRNSLKRLPGNKSQDGVDFSSLFIDGYALSNQQQVSLNWMLWREQTPLPFTEREIEECRFDPLNLRILGIAEREVSRVGGILADDVGYGKTVVSLALMSAQQTFDQTESRKARSASQYNTTALAASLVIVPRHLVNQWRDEAAKFIGWKGADVLTINSSRDLQDLLSATGSSGEASEPRAKKTKLSVDSTTLLDRLRAAKLIILNTSVFDDDYYAWLGKYAGSLAHPQTIPRSNGTRNTINPNVLGAFQDWYEDATEHARKHLAGFDSAVFNTSQIDTIQQRQRDLQNSWENVVADYYDEKTRLGMQAKRKDTTGLVDKSKKEVTVSKEYHHRARAEVLKKGDFKSGKSVYVLEAFSFARVIYDEFSYENFCVAQFVRNAEAHAKWILSATPPTGNLKAVCDIGKLLKVHVARPVKLRPGLPLITEGPTVLRQSSTDKQLSYQKLYTDKSVYERVDQGHKFLRHFASANPFDEEGLGKIKVTEKVYCSHLTRYEFAKYLDIQRDLQNSNLDISNLLSRHNLDSSAMVDFPPEGKLRAGLALAYVASVHSGGDHLSKKDLLESRRADLQSAMSRLREICSIAIWLVMRRYEENTDKKNDSATSIVEDFVYDFQAMIEGNTEAFGGIDGLHAVTVAVFPESDLSPWHKYVGGDVNIEKFFAKLYHGLNKATLGNTLVSYFQVTSSNVGELTKHEVKDLLEKFREGESIKKLGDKNARQLLEELIADKQGSSPDSDEGRFKESKNQPTYPRFGKQKRTRGATYTEIESELTDIMLKYVEAKEDVMARAKQVTSASNLFAGEAERSCSACGQSGSGLLFLPECGHFICPNHPEATHCGKIKTAKHPTGTGCSAVIRGRSISVKQIDRCSMHIERKGLPVVSSKSWNILKTIKQIRDTSDDKILVFYQFEEQMKEICSLLEHYELDYNTQPTSCGAESRSGKKKSSKDMIRIMKLSSEEAAGSNFQDANHVLFVSTPVFGKQEDFDRYVKQAKGRAVRHGQQKEVFIYYFASINTFEVDLLQLRKRSHIRLQSEDVATFVPKPGMHAPKRRDFDSDGDVVMKEPTSSEKEFTSGLSDDEVWRLTDETNWLVQQNREF